MRKGSRDPEPGVLSQSHRRRRRSLGTCRVGGCRCARGACGCKPGAFANKLLMVRTSRRSSRIRCCSPGGYSARRTSSAGAAEAGSGGSRRRSAERLRSRLRPRVAACTRSSAWAWHLAAPVPDSAASAIATESYASAAAAASCSGGRHHQPQLVTRRRPCGWYHKKDLVHHLIGRSTGAFCHLAVVPQRAANVPQLLHRDLDSVVLSDVCVVELLVQLVLHMSGAPRACEAERHRCPRCQYGAVMARAQRSQNGYEYI